MYWIAMIDGKCPGRMLTMLSMTLVSYLPKVLNAKHPPKSFVQLEGTDINHFSSSSLEENVILQA